MRYGVVAWDVDGEVVLARAATHASARAKALLEARRPAVFERWLTIDVADLVDEVVLETIATENA